MIILKYIKVSITVKVTLIFAEDEKVCKDKICDPHHVGPALCEWPVDVDCLKQWPCVRCETTQVFLEDCITWTCYPRPSPAPTPTPKPHSNQSLIIGLSVGLPLIFLVAFGLAILIWFKIKRRRLTASQESKTFVFLKYKTNNNHLYLKTF